jgi:uncharacterized ferritin-like protein (DUF455 family)
MSTVREFAERVLFGRTLGEKLAPPGGGLVDERRGPELAAPAAPGRPDELRLAAAESRAGFPGIAAVEDDRRRGELLHFFANHELLATELMALVLLKFPDAPAAFRAGVVDTLREEQMHTKLYLRRMGECGVAFGELPVNGYFWNLVAPMATPLDYVTRLSLTFEQANLDYAKGYARVFAEAGDGATAAILERIYTDEIGHVSYGLEWFRRWRRGSSDWKSFCSLVGAPLSPARAKGGFGFNEPGRREAGFDEEFIRELRVFSRSKGRTPDVFWFHPGAEDELAGRPPGRAGERVRRDLELLVACVARADDVVMLDRVPDLAHRTALTAAGIEMPELVAWSAAAEVAVRKLGRARPWAATPRTTAQAAALGLDLTSTPPACFSKARHADFLREVLAAGGWEPLADPGTVGQRARSVDEVDAMLRRSSGTAWIIKAPLSTAGRERLRPTSPGSLSAGEARRLDAMLAEAGEVVVEPWLERVLDFSFQYDRDPDVGLRRRGMVVMENSAGGQFRAARVTRRLTDFLGPGDRRTMFRSRDRRGGLPAWWEDVFEPRLDAWLGGSGYRGPLGVDAMLFRDAAGQLRCKPVVEINPRLTMGRVALELDRFRSGPGASELRIQAIRDSAPPDAVRLTPETPGARLAAYWRVVPTGSGT